MPNFAETGSYEKLHVKWRVMEAGLSGCLLLETKGAPTCRWFDPGVDYLEWGTFSEAQHIVESMTPKDSEQFGLRLRAKVLANHTPEKFWQRVMERI